MVGETESQLLKISFVIGQYKPGKCGISDYVDLLSRQLKIKGHSIVQYSIKKPNDFVNFSKNLIDADLFSFQFAPYAFSKNGLSGKTLFTIAHALRNKKTQINFHEIWIGAYPKANWKDKLIGWMQKREILTFLKITAPSLVSTSNPAALNRLKKEGIDARYLYLPGNIPKIAFTQTSKEQKIKVALFGTLYANFPYDLLADRLTNIAELLKLPIELKIIGRQRETAGFKHLESIARNNHFAISKTGELTASNISKELQTCSIGVSSTPYDILGKSGATAAMLEHGLPIFAYDDGDTNKESLFVFKSFQDQVFLINHPNHVNNIVESIQGPKKPFFDGVAHTGCKMLEMIN